MNTHTKTMAVGILLGVMALGISKAKAVVPPPSLKLDVRPVQPMLEVASSKQTVVLRVAVEGLQAAPTETRAPVNLALVLDRSGSMSGEKIEKAKEAALMVVDRLRPNDIISLIMYDDYVNVLLPATRLTNKASVRELIQGIAPGGSTALFGGVSKGIAEVRKFKEQGVTSRVILVSDGMANVGPSSPAELAALGRSAGREGIPITTIGLGLGYNEDLMSQLALNSDGNHDFVENAVDLARVFDRELGEAMSVVAQNVNIYIHCPAGVRPVRAIDREAAIKGQEVSFVLNQVLSGQERFLLLEVEVPPGQDGTKQPLAKVEAKFADQVNRNQANIASEASVQYTRNTQVARNSVDKKVKADAIRAQANELSKQAVQLRDAGNLPAAQAVVNSQVEMLNKGAAELNDTSLKEEGKAAASSAVRFEDEASWGSERKALRSKQLKTSIQKK